MVKFTRATAVMLGTLLATQTLAAQDTVGIYSSRISVPVDANGFLLDPQWLSKTVRRPNVAQDCRFRVSNSELSRRTLWVTGRQCVFGDEQPLLSLNEPGSTLGEGFECSTGSLVGTVRGHVNWFPVTVTGQLHWDSYAEDPGDHDVTVQLRPWRAESAALTSGNGGADAAYHVELYDAESFLRLPSGRSWWHDFRDALTDNDAMRALLDGNPAIVSGMYGLDAVHGFQAELHPVFGMAVLIRSALGTQQAAERWAIFVRNRGNEGDCAAEDLPLITPATITKNGEHPRQHFVMDLGWWPGANAADVALANGWSSDSTEVPSARPVSGTNLFIDVPTPRPGVEDRSDFAFVGTIDVTWKGALQPSSSRFAGNGGASKTANHATQFSSDTRFASCLKPVLDLYSCLKPVQHVGQLSDIENWTPRTQADGPFVYRAVPWNVQAAAARIDCDTLTRSRLCHREWRLEYAWATSTRQWDASAVPARVSAFLFANSWTCPDIQTTFGSWWPCEPELLWDFLSGFNYRLEFDTRERFRRDADWHTGQGYRLSFIIGPNEIRLGPTAQVSPYLVLSPGLSVLSGTSRAGSVGSGAGLHLFLGQTDYFVEVQGYTRAGGFDSRTTVSVGTMITGDEILKTLGILLWR